MIDEAAVEVYADDTTLWCDANDCDAVIAAVSKALGLVDDWCSRHAMAHHAKKCEAMLILRQKFVGPLQALMINDTLINLVSSTRCCGFFFWIIKSAGPLT